MTTNDKTRQYPKSSALGKVRDPAQEEVSFNNVKAIPGMAGLERIQRKPQRYNLYENLNLKPFSQIQGDIII